MKKSLHQEGDIVANSVDQSYQIINILGKGNSGKLLCIKNAQYSCQKSKVRHSKVKTV